MVTIAGGILIAVAVLVALAVVIAIIAAIWEPIVMPALCIASVGGMVWGLWEAWLYFGLLLIPLAAMVAVIAAVANAPEIKQRWVDKRRA